MKIGSTLIFILLYTQAYTQNTVFNYKLYSIADNTNIHKLNNKFGISISNQNDTVEYKLLFNGQEGLFTAIDKLNNSQTKDLSFIDVFKKTQGDFYFNHETKSIENSRESSMKHWIITSPYSQINWVITDEIEEIAGKLCKKAIYTKEDYGLRETKIYTTTVWFIENSAYTVAPFGLMGLNGLIVKANFNNRFEVILDDIKTNQKGKIAPFTKGRRITLGEFNANIKVKIDDYRKRRQERISMDK